MIYYFPAFQICTSMLLVAMISVSFPVRAFAEGIGEGRPSVAKYVKAYKGGEGISVWTTRFGTPDEHKALIQFGGADNDYDMKILLADVEKTGKDSRYSINHNGQKFVIFIVSDGTGLLYFPNSTESVSVGYSENASNEANSEHFLTDYLEQRE
ncbi:hypothetical protein NJB93_18295 [Brucella intermedia]|uniref:hypothetical protein n=1 Tax=Brucella intermedia TaxID=94625 RepID=UPI00209B7BF5|nr:hypothetical protein [Brucella intermedia]MCO7728540.1 hypothetical protein [Brucella intermedia]